MFVVVTAVCCFLGYELDWIRQRHRFIETHNPDAFRSDQDTRAPQLLWCFGEQGMNNLLFDVDPKDVSFDPTGRRYIRSNTPVVATARRLFPESRIRAMDSMTNPSFAALPVEIID
jgi:hypothetical protein